MNTNQPHVKPDNSGNTTPVPTPDQAKPAVETPSVPQPGIVPPKSGS